MANPRAACARDHPHPASGWNRKFTDKPLKKDETRLTGRKP
jgi:hypothetical protein